MQTTGQIAERFGARLHQVEYVIKSRGIKPTARAGHYRLYNEKAVGLIGRELRAIAANKELAR